MELVPIPIETVTMEESGRYVHSSGIKRCGGKDVFLPFCLTATTNTLKCDSQDHFTTTQRQTDEFVVEEKNLNQNDCEHIEENDNSN